MERKVRCMSNKAEKLFLGNIVTMDERYNSYKALTVKDGRVQYVGSERVARELCDENTEVIDFGDSFVYPGMIEAHCHPDLAGLRLALQADLSVGQSMEEYYSIIARFIEDNPDFDEYRGAGWCEQDEKPNRFQLDKICADKPIVLNSIDGHSMWMNTAACEKYGINEEAVKTWGTEIIRINDDGTPTGYISEGPTNDINGAGKYSFDQLVKSFMTWQKFVFSKGFTSVFHAGAKEKTLGLYKKLYEEYGYKVRTYAAVIMDEREEDYCAFVRNVKELADKYNSEYLKVIGVKVFMDGVVEAHTAWVQNGYKDDPSTSGVKRMRDPERFTAMLEEAAKNGLMVHCHTIGDGAIKFALDCIEKAETNVGKMNMRNALAHLQVFPQDLVQQLVDVNAVAVVAPLWTPKDPNYFSTEAEYLGEEAALTFYPIASVHDKGGIVAFHSDYPVSSAVSIPRSIYTAVTRKNPGTSDDCVRNAAECIDRFSALCGLTTGAAYSVCDEKNIGKLVIGYHADMTVYDTDFMNADIETIANARLVATVVDGEVVYK